MSRAKHNTVVTFVLHKAMDVYPEKIRILGSKLRQHFPIQRYRSLVLCGVSLSHQVLIGLQYLKLVFKKRFFTKHPIVGLDRMGHNFSFSQPKVKPLFIETDYIIIIYIPTKAICVIVTHFHTTI